MSQRPIDDDAFEQALRATFTARVAHVGVTEHAAESLLSVSPVRSWRRALVAGAVSSVVLVAAVIAIVATRPRHDGATVPIGGATPAPTTTTSAPAPPCAGVQTAVQLVQAGAASGRHIANVVVRNTSNQPCTLSGYPNVTLNFDAPTGPQSAVKDPWNGPLPSVRLAPSQLAAAMMTEQAYDVAAQPPHCSTGLTIDLTLPRQTKPTRVDAKISSCLRYMIAPFTSNDTTPTATPASNAPATPCAAGTLQARFVLGGNGGGNDMGSIWIWNPQPTPCTISGPVAFTATYADSTPDPYANVNGTVTLATSTLPANMTAPLPTSDPSGYLLATLIGPERDDPTQPDGLCRTSDEKTPASLALTLGSLTLDVVNKNPTSQLTGIHGCHGRVLLEDVTAPAAAGSSTTPCDGSALEASVGESGPANGTENIVILVRNVSSAPCWLGGLPTLSGIDATGQATKLRFTASSDPAYANPGPVTGPGQLAPNGYGAMLLTVCIDQPRGKCPADPHTYTGLRIDVAHGHVDLPYPATLTLGAAGNQGPFGPVPGPTGLLGR